ncbi:O-acetyl-ADP-ribose deacetylase [Hoeflea poritis]|uniref:O-acetyl-ADP-ribose deacetylase n=1 Tax=Hoeflea poritis TaxID=2993659 RepID=A0ABT4VPQ6_9HYPH|nr:O-acetyl-ADP-ribose deacetylase [Hoeflea poritis]MDA4846692.1 O-acetyl-ADP-ribose deacetylase [Hoeflea poritis]
MELRLLKADITTLEVGAVVNAANSSLLGGGGVDGAIHRAGGPRILEECKAIVKRIGRCPPGEAVMTSGGNLPADHVIHTVGPVWRGGKEGEPALLASCYARSLQLCVDNDIRSVAFPNISTGIYGYPKQPAADIAVTAVRAFSSSAKIDTVIFACFDDENHEIYRALL